MSYALSIYKFELTQISRICNISCFKCQPYVAQVHRENGVSSVSLPVYTIYIYIEMVYHTEEGQTVITY